MLSLLAVVLLNVQMVWTQPRCNPYYGPAGTTVCAKLVGYINYQWATCLTNSYIKQKSGHRHACIDSSATYCWYQCMVEVYHQNFGFVRGGCKCTPGEAIGSSLPQACFSPSGDSCDWYRNCLKRKYSCDDTSNAYAVSFSKKFCELYDEQRALFSADGQKWVDAVRRCLQVALVPLVRPWVTASCYNLRQKALATHIPCYMKPDQNVSSVCDLNCKDYLRVFWSIKGSFIKMDVAWESLKGLWNIETRCTGNSRIRQCLKNKETVGGVMKFMKIVVKKTQRLVTTPQHYRFADEVGSSIASVLNWNSTLIDWIAYTVRFPAGDDVEITIVLADKKALGIVKTTTPSVNLTSIINEFASAVEEGKLALQVDEYKVLVKFMALCSDKACARTQTLAVLEEPTDFRRTMASSSSGNPATGPNGKARILHGEAARLLYGKVWLLGVLVFSFLFQSFF